MEVQKIAIKYGIITGMVLIVYFLLLSTIDLHLQPVFSFANLLISGTGIYLAILELKKSQNESFKYQFGFGAGLITGFTATVVLQYFLCCMPQSLILNFRIDLWSNGSLTGSPIQGCW